MSKLNLMADLEADIASPKKKYQIFEVRLGFEKASVMIPLENADEFERTAAHHRPKSLSTLIKLAGKFGGKPQ